MQLTSRDGMLGLLLLLPPPPPQPPPTVTIIFFLVRPYYLFIDYVCIKFVRYNLLKVSHHCNV
jgi:hypothetical protein